MDADAFEAFVEAGDAFDPAVADGWSASSFRPAARRKRTHFTPPSAAGCRCRRAVARPAACSTRPEAQGARMIGGGADALALPIRRQKAAGLQDRCRPATRQAWCQARPRCGRSSRSRPGWDRRSGQRIGAAPAATENTSDDPSNRRGDGRRCCRHLVGAMTRDTREEVGQKLPGICRSARRIPDRGCSSTSRPARRSALRPCPANPPPWPGAGPSPPRSAETKIRRAGSAPGGRKAARARPLFQRDDSIRPGQGIWPNSPAR